MCTVLPLKVIVTNYWSLLEYQTKLFSFPSPSGWDNEKKIAILHENFTTVRPEDPFEDFIMKPPVRKV